jgi:pyruvate formate-lyase activating enzyme-like uncharacterized protein
MKYTSLRFADMMHGPGTRVTLFISDEDNKDDLEFNNHTLEDIVRELENDEYDGFTLCGSFLNLHNIEPTRDVIRTLRSIFGCDKSIMLHVQSLDEIKKNINNSDVDELLSYVDLLHEVKSSSTYHVIKYAYGYDFIL